ncbi:response regulator [Fulvivirgaceae bacterium BMA10]|uniref:Response regulator n=1 Tax=Splendidivirga corallicola TaxID=3051826 RepID=A0ABT8KUL6_9BACT|nr:response regulator [Fulvivirgaceae bacterium BMA10]
MKRILLIDDEDINLFIIQNLIRLSGIEAEVIFFSSCQKGIDYVKQLIDNDEEMPDLILLDIDMPVMTGWDFLDKYRNFNEKKKRETVLKIFTTSIIETDIQKAKEYPDIDGYLNKPMTIDMIRKIEADHFN